MSSSMPELSQRRNDDYYEDEEIDDDEDIEDFYDDDFTRFVRYRGQEIVQPPEPHHRRGRYVCLHYYSNTVGLTFDDKTNIEVYRMEQIKEWSSIDPNWLDSLRDELEVQASGLTTICKKFRNRFPKSLSFLCFGRTFKSWG